MTGSLKRQPSEEPEESPKAKRRESPGAAEPSTAAPTEASPTAEKKGEAAPLPPSFLSPPTRVSGFSITEKCGLAPDKGKINGNSTSILSSGFSLASGSSLFSPSTNGSSFGSSGKGTNIFAAALSNVNSGGGIFGSATSSVSSAFVFGGNMSDRVITPVAKDSETTEEVAKKPDEPDKEDEAKKEDEQSSAETNSKTTSESKKVSLKELEVTSGEEDEKRILQTSCKLYQFCPVGKTWIGRGVGTLRLNEKEKDGVSTSRLVVRSKAVMRVMLNTKIFADMIVNRANLTTIRISGLDQGKMCTFLLKCTRNECDKLHTALLKKREDERHKVGETAPNDRKVISSEQEPPQPDTAAELLTTETEPSPSDPKITSNPASSDDKTLDQDVETDDNKPNREVLSSDETSNQEMVPADSSTQEVVSAPADSTEKPEEDPVPESESDTTVNGAKSHGVPEDSSESETPKGSTDEPEKTVS